MKKKITYIKIIGKTNTGKSTLFNKLIGKKISITSKKKHTTQTNICNIQTKNNHQIYYIDTPGLKYTKHNSKQTTTDENIIIFVLDRLKWTKEDDLIFSELKKKNKKVFLIINKIDKIKNKNKLLPHIKFLNEKTKFNEIFPISAKNKTNILSLIKYINNNSVKLYNHININITNTYSKNFIISEIIKEKLMRFLGDEIPYTSTIKIQKIQTINNMYHIQSSIYVLKNNQKKIIIGKHGNKIKNITFYARKDIEKHFKKKIFLNIIIKIKTK